MCVAANTELLYRRLRTTPIMGRSIVAADLLVLLRGAGRMDIDCAPYQSVHVFNYVGQDRSQIRLRNVRHLVVIEHQPSMRGLRPSADRLPDAVISGRHAVYPELWRREPDEIRTPSCHIGNYKPISGPFGSDPCQSNLVRELAASRLPVWGRGWNAVLDHRCLRGSVSLWRVPRIFAKARSTLGLRYPYQREHDLISSRYWLAPLAGCPVLSDEPALLDAVPGTLFGPYSSWDQINLSTSDRRSLAEEAARFWADRTSVLEDALRSEVRRLEPRTGTLIPQLGIRARYAVEVLARKAKSALERA